MFVLIPVVVEAGLEACVVFVLSLMAVKLELHLQDIVEMLRVGKQALRRRTDDGKERYDLGD